MLKYHKLHKNSKNLEGHLFLVYKCPKNVSIEVTHILIKSYMVSHMPL
jgi:hypothetical protein